MGSWIAVIVAVVVIVVIVAAITAAVIVVPRRRRERSDRSLPAPVASGPAATPMTDLESALAQVTDRDGRPIREKIDAESVHVDPLRDPNDTGPLLRRALDSVAHHDDGRDDGHVDPPTAGDHPPADPDATT